MQGLEKFKEYMKDFSSDYVIIGGTATVMALEENDLPARATKDIDMIVIFQPDTKHFMKRFWEFVKAGGYKLYRAKGETQHPRFFRFVQPEDIEFPAQIEIFSTVPDNMDVPHDIHIVHVPMDGYTSSFSAIILDKAYYDFAVEHSHVVNDIRILNPEAIIVLKALAFMGNLKLKREGLQIDQKNIDKHKRDIYRLAYTFDGSERFDVDDQVKELLRNFILVVKENPVDGRNMFRGQGIPVMTMPDFINILSTLFML